MERGSDNFSDALFWGGYEYYTGTWRLSEDVIDVNFDVNIINKEKNQRRFDIVFNKVNNQPSDPYSSMRSEREITASLVVTTEGNELSSYAIRSEEEEEGYANDEGNDIGAGAGGASDKENRSSGGGLTLSNVEGLMVKFKELRICERQGSISESFTE
jgi:hypothetical protein